MESGILSVTGLVLVTLGRHVLRMVLRGGLTPVAIGLVAGVGAAAGTACFLDPPEW